MTFELTTQAIEDLDEIWYFIARDSRDAADRVEGEIIATCRRLAAYPLIGHQRLDVTPLPVRFWTLPKYPNYVVIYRAATAPVQVVAILHGNRDLRQIMKDRG